MSSKKYVLGSIQIVDGTQGSGKLLTSDVNGLSTWGFSVPTIDITRDNLYLGLTSSTLKKGATYYITDRKIWLKALDVNLLSTSGQRKMTIVRNEAYRSTLPNTYGVWNPANTYVIGDKVVWGAKVWENLTGSVGSSDYPTYYSSLALDNVNWVEVVNTNTTYYFDKIFNITYNVINDSIYSQSDDRGNVIYEKDPVDGTYEPDATTNVDWGDTFVANNINNGPIINNIGKVYSNIMCGAIVQNISIVTSFGISRNINIIGGIYENKCNYGISRNDLLNNNIGISYNTISNTIASNRITGAISGNNIVGFISNNTNIGDISSNTGTGTIVNNSNNGNIYNNVITGDIYRNSNNGDITSNTTVSLTGNYIVRNSNNGDISNNTQTSGNTIIANNNNNGQITGARTGNVYGTIVNI